MKLVYVTTTPDRPSLLPEALVNIQSRIPGLDVVVENAKGYVFQTINGVVTVALMEGEAAIGDEVVLLPGQFLHGHVPNSRNPWRHMGAGDVKAAAESNPPAVGALCVMASKYNGDWHASGNFEKDTYKAYRLYREAMKHRPSGHCALQYSILIKRDDKTNTPPRFRANVEESLKWLFYAAENGHYLSRIFVAEEFERRGKLDQALYWVEKALEVDEDQWMSQDTKDRILSKMKRQ